MSKKTNTTRFWESKRLAQMNRQEWELLCDGCARCCLHSFEDEDSGELFKTRIACRLLDLEQCRCTSYAKRHASVPECVSLQAEQVNKFAWLPASCAYRLVAEGKPLAWWHHLVSGDRESVHVAGISMRGKMLSEQHVHPDAWDEHIIQWVD